MTLVNKALTPFSPVSHAADPYAWGPQRAGLQAQLQGFVAEDDADAAHAEIAEGNLPESAVADIGSATGDRSLSRSIEWLAHP